MLHDLHASVVTQKLWFEKGLKSVKLQRAPFKGKKREGRYGRIRSHAGDPERNTNTDKNTNIDTDANTGTNTNTNRYKYELCLCAHPITQERITLANESVATIWM